MLRIFVLLLSLIMVMGGASWYWYRSVSEAAALETFRVWTSFSTKRWVPEEASLVGGKVTTPREAYEHIVNMLEFFPITTEAEREAAIAAQRIVPLPGNEHYTLSGVSSPYVLPVGRMFVERLAEQYHEADCGILTVTSAHRFPNAQPGNASRWSVHPMGAAVDLRIPADEMCRSWLHDTLLAIESQGRVDATQETRPPHFHVVVDPGQYGTFLQNRLTDEEKRQIVTEYLNSLPVR